MTIELSYADDLATTTWKSPASGLWVATKAGDYLGMVERIDGRYFTNDTAGNDLGAFDELADAQMALDGFADETGPTPRDVLMTKAIVAMTGIASVALALSAIIILR